jgi:hypothetical protein
MPGSLSIAMVLVAIYLSNIANHLTKGTLWNGSPANPKDKAAMLIIFGFAFYSFIGLFLQVL